MLRGEAVRDYEYAVLSKEGDLRFRRANGQQLADPDGRVIGAVVALLDITEQRRIERELRRQALYDGLTGLANRALLTDRLSRALHASRANGRVIVMSFDVDRLAWVNEAHGHAVGDRLLIALATRLKLTVRADGTVARGDGDEFVVIAEEGDEELDVESMAVRIAADLSEPVELDDVILQPTVSVGVAVSWPGECSPEVLLSDADIAMNWAKEQGGDGVAVYDSSMRASALRRADVQARIEAAVDEGRLFLRFQPIVDARTERVVGAEALLRIDTGDEPALGPAEFIPIAEQTGIVERLDRWVLAEVVERAAAWRERFPQSPVRIACNVSPRTMSAPGWADEVVLLLEEHGVASDQLKLELTETAMVDVSEEARRELGRLRRLGVHVGLDDFGTGFATLTHLQTMPVNFLKIDRSFVSGLGFDPQSRAIVDATIRMADALGLSTVAEGVETIEQASVLRELGCGALQGFLYSTPLLAHDFERLLANDAVALALGRLAGT